MNLLAFLWVLIDCIGLALRAPLLLVVLARGIKGVLLLDASRLRVKLYASKERR